ncbi:MAG TPA: TilS substrate-binding domain-containing protein [Myxococcota bacterium]|jgi:hypothetical protein|nr:TilS substrate-binding domain-containing protein [Myxococcota bacterium]
MADSAAFLCAFSALEKLASLSSAEARFTLRLALQQAGFEAPSVSAREMAVVVERVLPGELRSKKVAQPEQVCRGVSDALAQLRDDAPATALPDAVFGRLGGA